MFTILNIINYYTSKIFSVNLLIILTIAIYSFLIYQYLDVIYNNTALLITFIIFMIIDLTSIILIYTYSFTTNDKTNIFKTDELKKNKKTSKNNKKNISKTEKEINNKLINKTKNNIINDDINNDKISLYKSNMECSINTYL
jgi:predicted membrane protein